MKLGWLYRISWIAFLVSSAIIIAGGLILLKTHQNVGVYITYAGFMSLALSGFLMTRAMELSKEAEG